MQIYLVFLRRVSRNLRTLLAFAMLVAATVLSTPMRAQTLRDYEFSTGVDASKWITTSDWTTIFNSGVLMEASSVMDIGFSFPFGDSTYTQFSVSVSGIFRLGPEATANWDPAGTFNSTYYIFNLPRISGVARYGNGLGTGSNGYIRYAVTGTAPNRVLVCEYRMAPFAYPSNNADVMWQVQLYETTGEISIVYGSTTPAICPLNFQTGLATSATDFVLLSPDTHTPVYSNTYNNTTYNTWHGGNRYYSFTLPSSTCPRPESIAVSNIGTTSLTATWVDNSGATQWEVHIDSRNLQGTPVVVNTPSYTFTGLTNGTDYTVRVRGICGPGDTTAVRSLPVQTLCGYLQLPYSESFEDALGTVNTNRNGLQNNLPNCWDYHNEGSNNYSIYPYVIIGSGHSGVNFMRCYVLNNSNYSPQYAFLPLTDPIRHPVNSLELSYWTSRYTLNQYGTCIVGITPDPTDISTFIPVDTLIRNSGEWYMHTVHFNNYTGPHGRVTMLFPKQTSNPNYTFIDDIYLFSHNSFDTVTQTACNSYTWPENGTTYTNSGTYDTTLPNAAGYDSIITLQLTVYHSYAGDTTAAVCDSITWRGNYYSVSGNYIDTIFLSPLVGCDSTTTLHLTVNHRSGLPAILPGATESHFSVSSTQTVQFSKGNLQYQASTGKWRFAEHQYDYVGSDNHNISSTYNGWIDLFGWGTSGWNSGATAYQPYSSSNSSNDYRPGNNSYTDLTGSYAEADWGWHNAIQNGGNRNHLWRTLIHTEWVYLFNTRTTNTNLGTPNARYAKASINGTKGVILFPDEYTHPANVAVPVGINATDNTGLDGNTYSTTDWDKMDSAGAVFLPAAGVRGSINYSNSGPTGFYWAADRHIFDDSFAYNINFNNTSLHLSDYSNKYSGYSVRPVHNTDPVTTNDTVAEACDSFTWWNTNYTNSTNTPTHLYSTTAGCDSLVTLHLTINLSTTGDTTATACDSFTWWGTTYTSSTNTATHSFTNAAGCDSVVTLHLTIYHSYAGDTTAVVCDSITWRGNYYSESGNYIDTIFLSPLVGCDSTATLHLTVNHRSGLPTILPGATESHFSVSSTQTVQFSKGNLQYQASTGLWRFAEHQYDYIGDDNTNISSTYDGWIDLFGWGTSGWNSGATAYQPYSFFNNSNYYQPGNNANTDLTGSYAEADWGWHNAIQNGGNRNHLWRTLIHTEWEYLFNTRTTNTNLGTPNARYAKASINGTKGVILFPDEYTHPANVAVPVGINATNNTGLDGNTYSTTDWDKMDSAGAVFLPAAGSRGNKNYFNSGPTGFYWAADRYIFNDRAAYNIKFNNTSLHLSDYSNKCYGFSVRPVHNTDPVITNDTVAEACDSFTWWNTNYTNSTNTPTHLYSTTAGCDSLVTLHLTINLSTTGDTTATACDSFTWWGTTYTSSTNTATHTFTNAAGCDSVVTLHLTIKHSTTGDTTVTTCNSFTWWNTNYTNSTNSATHIFTNAAGCDSVVTLHLTINHSNTGDTTVTACDSFSWWNTNYTNSTNSATHTFTNAAGCDSVVTLHLTINHSNTGDTTATACDSFSWWNTNYTNSTNSATHTFTNAAGCDSVVTLHLTINHSNTGDTNATACNSFTWWNTNYTNSTNSATHTFTNAAGCDSVVTLHLTVNHSNTGDTNATACNSFTWWNTNYTNSTNSATHIFTNAAGCDSVVTLHLTVNYSTTGIEDTTVCNSIVWHGTEYTTSTNTPTFTCLNAAGCDSVTTLHLTVNHCSTTPINVCDSYTWRGHTYTTTGIYIDGTDTLNLTVNHSNTGDTLVTACDSFTWWGTTYTSSTNTATHTFTNAAGCDSTVTLHLTIKNSSTGDTTTTACNSFTWWNTNYTNSTNSATHTFTNAAGCDSVVTLHLTINHSTTGDTTVTACDSFTWWNTNYTNSTNSATHTFTNVVGCDSVVTLHLTVNNSTTGDTTVTACDSFTWWGSTYTSSTNTATQTFTNLAGCDYVVTLHLTINHSNTGIEDTTVCNSYVWHGTTYTASTNTPTFTCLNAAGCDSVTTLHLTVNQCSSTSVTTCDSYTWRGHTYTATGIYTDGIDTLHLTINHSNTGDTTVTACDNFTWHGTTYTGSTQNSTFTIQNSVGCDSVVTLHLTINHSNAGDTNVTACNSFTWWNTNYTNSTNSATHTFTNVAGCDSVVTLHLTVNHSNTGDTTVTACDSFTWWGTNYTNNTNTATHTFTNATGCDSVVTLHLTVNYSSTGIEDTTVCNSFIWHGTEYTSSTQNSTFTIQNSVGCDSTVTLHLTVNQCSSTTVTVCDSYIWHGNTYTTTGIYTDGTDTLNLTINNSTTGDTTVTACDSFIWHGTTYTGSTQNSTFTIQNSVGCDSVVTLHLTVNPTAAINHTPDTTILIGQSVTLHVNNIDNVTWYDSDNNIISISDSLVVSPTASTTYYISGFNQDTSIALNGDFEAGNVYFTSGYTYTSNLVPEGKYYVGPNAHNYHAGFPNWPDHTTGNGNYMIVNGTTSNGITVWSQTVPVIPHTDYDFSAWVCNVSLGNPDNVAYLQFSINGTQLGNIFHCPASLYTWEQFYELWNSGDNTTATISILNLNTTSAGNDFGIDDISFSALTSCIGYDSIHVNIQSNSHTYIDICDNQLPYTWNGSTFTSGGVYDVTIPRPAGIDSIATLHLTVKNSTTGDTTATACDSFTWHGTTYTGSTQNSTFTIQNSVGCDSVVTLHLTVNYSNTGIEDTTVCNSFVWHGTTYTASTNTPTFTCLNAAGCDSVTTLHLIVNQCSSTSVTACDSFTWRGNTYNATGNYIDGTDTLHLTINLSTTGDTTAMACDSFTWHGTTYTGSTQNSTFTIQNSVGCDSVVTLHLTINYSSTGIEDTTVCNSFIWHGTTYTESTQNSTFTIHNSVGCDSTVTLHLTVNQCSSTIDTACDSYTWHGNTYTATGIYTDNADTLHLTINHSTIGDTTVTACDSFTWHGTTYTGSTQNSTFTIQNSVGCDSVVTLHLTVNYSNTGIEDTVVCNSFVWHGTTYTASTNTPTYTCLNAAGCDSVTTLHLTVNQCSSTSVTACDSYTWRGSTYTATGIYTDNADTLHLTINYSTTGDTTATACDSFTWHGTTYTESTQSPTFTIQNANGCDSTITLSLTIYNSTSATDNVTSCVPLQWIDGNTYTASTDSPVFTIQSVHGCDSVITLHFELLPASYTDIVDSFCTGTSYQFGALTLTEGGLYTDTLTATNTCDSIVSLNLTKLPLPYINIVKDDDCQTQTHHIHVETDVDYLYWTCDAQSWNNSWGSVHSSNLTVNSPVPITFTLMADYHEYPTCPNTAMTTLQPIVQPHALMTVSPEFITYETPTLVALSQSTGAKSLQWYIDGDDAGNSHSITYTPPSGYDSVVVTLIAFSDLCSDTTEKTIPIKQQTLYLPNAFTPNESTNNTFSVFYDGIIEYELYIYNRQGILLFQSKTNGEAWDGRYNGMPCPEGSYVWLVKYRSEVDPQYWHYDKGTVTILY